ncbi:hypothetical protein AB833_05635 [Chromatiales bacterium (ex Bugula neritina AB1)]|nr:hypothetical protein AB833_05635 [Chromatiales bacterium (ex Bugula neritina AB1)]
MYRITVLGLLALCCCLTTNVARSQSTLSVGTIERPPFVMRDNGGALTGFSVEMWDEIARRIGVDYEWQVHDQFSLMIDEAIAGKTDIAVANISITSKRESVADFSQPIFESGMAIAVRKGGGTSYLGLIWESGILLFLLGALLLLFVISNLIWFFERGVEDSRHDYFRDDYIGGVWDAFWWAFVIMTMGGFEKEVPHKIINRVLAMFWIITSLFFISTLTAKITTALTVAELKSGIETYKDLAGKSVAVTEGSSHQSFLESNDIRPLVFTTLDDLYVALESQKVDAIVADFPILSYHASGSGRHWMMLTGEVFNQENYGILMAEGSPHAESIDQAILKMREEGFYRNLYQTYFGDSR